MITLSFFVGEWDLMEKVWQLDSLLTYDEENVSILMLFLRHQELKKNGIQLIPIKQNLIDLIWKTKPKPVKRNLIVLNVTYSGK